MTGGESPERVGGWRDYASGRLKQGIRTVKADLHNHLRTSSCWRERDFDRAVRIAQNMLGAGGVFGLVNFSDKRYETFSELEGYDRTFVGEGGRALYVLEKDILVVKGQEVPTQQGHLLVLALPKNIHLRERETLSDTIKEAHDYNGTVVADHLFYKDGIGEYVRSNPKILEQIDAIETFNGEAGLWLPGLTPKGANDKAYHFMHWERYRIAPQIGRLGEIIASDGHSFRELGKCWTALDVPRDYTKFDATEFRNTVRCAPSEEGFFVPGGFGYTCRITNEKRHSRIAALNHVAILAALSAGSELPRIVRKTLGIERYYSVPRPENLE